MTFIEVWEETTSYLRHTARAAAALKDVDPDIVDELRRACLVSADMLDIARRRFDRRRDKPCEPPDGS